MKKIATSMERVNEEFSIRTSHHNIVVLIIRNINFLNSILSTLLQHDYLLKSVKLISPLNSISHMTVLLKKADCLN